MQKKITIFLIWVLLLAVVFYVPLSALVRASMQAGYSSHIVLIPFITAYLIWSERSKIFAKVDTSVLGGAVLGSFGLLSVLGWVLFAPRYAVALTPFLTVLSVVMLLIGGFVWIFGTSALKQSLFPFLLLTLVLPVPGRVIEGVIHLLQSGSAHLSAWMFSALGVPVLQNGFLLTVPGVTIEVAEECSGINSSIALLIVALLFAHETLSSNARRAFLVFLVFPLSILKNAIRIVTLTLLATKVDPGFLTGRLHHEGGFVFFLITMVLVYPIWKLLRSCESRANQIVQSCPATLQASNLP